MWPKSFLPDYFLSLSMVLLISINHLHGVCMWKGEEYLKDDIITKDAWKHRWNFFPPPVTVIPWFFAQS